jgi:hypothetical protein
LEVIKIPHHYPQISSVGVRLIPAAALKHNRS